MYTSLKLLICISGWFHDAPAEAIQHIAQTRGYATYWAEKGEDLQGQGCAVVVMPSDADWAKPSMVGLDTGPKGWRPLSNARVADALTAWEAWR